MYDFFFQLSEIMHDVCQLSETMHDARELCEKCIVPVSCVKNALRS